MMLTHIITFTVWALLNVKAEDVLSMSHEIKARIEPPEEAPQPKRPVITSSSSRQHILIGTAVVFPCKVENLGSNVVVWKRGSTHILFTGALQVDSDESLSMLDDNTLKIRSVTSEHAGNYICQVSSSPPMELTHFLEVLVPPKITTDPLDGQVVVKKDDTVTLKCHAEGYPTPIITWSSMEGNLPRGIPEKQGNTLTIASVDTYHSTEYECKAHNDVGDPVTAVFTVRVLYSPEVEVKPVWLHAGLGSAVEFSCIVSADPPATLRWTRSDGSPLYQDGHVSIHPAGASSKVKINGITKEHLGGYICSANNSLGSSKETVEVSGLAEPVNFKSNSTGEDNTSFLLWWSVKSYSRIIEYLLRIRKRKEDGVDEPPGDWNDVIIPPDIQQSVLHSQSYNVTGLEPATAYEAVMQARNEFGWNHPSDTFTFYTYGGGQPQGVMEEQPFEPTTLLDPTTNHKEGEAKENDLEMEVTKDAAVNHKPLEYKLMMFIVFLASVISYKL